MRRFLQIQPLQCVVLAAVLASASVIEAGQLGSLGNANSWLQLQAGNWIIAHRAVPQSGIFSESSDLPWADPNWGLQTALAVLYRGIGIRAIPVGVMVLRMLFALAVFVLAGGRGNFWRAVVISVWAQAAWVGASSSAAGAPNILCSASLLAAELVLILRSRIPGRQKLLYWIPPLLCLWANLDWHFVIGVAVLCLYCAASAIEPYLHWHFGSPDRPALPLSLLGLVAAIGCVASVVSPSSYHSYATAWQNLFGASPLYVSLAMKALTFREAPHYLLMFLAMCAFLLLGRQQARDLFLLLLLAGGVCLGFALGVEIWIVAVTSVAVIGDYFSGAYENAAKPERMSGIVLGAGAAMAAIVLIIAAARIPSNSATLLNVTANSLPVRACDFIRSNNLPRPVYNRLEWGGFVAWYLPEYPVSIDERYELYGETRTASYYKVTGGVDKPSSDPAFASANTILLSPGDSLIRNPDMFPNPEEVFRFSLPGFREVYRDDLAVVLTKQP